MAHERRDWLGECMRIEDREDFTAFVLESSPNLMRVAFLLTGDRGLAEDLLQTSLEKTYRRWPGLREPDAAYAYVRRAMVNTHISWRRRRTVPEVLIETLPDRVADPAPHAPSRSGAALAALAGLPPRMRTVIVLRFYEGLSEADTAAAMGSSIGSVKSQASRGLARLRIELDQPTPSFASGKGQP